MPSPQPLDSSSRLSVMTFLNEIAELYPAAISFASGRPAEAFSNIQMWLEHIPAFVHYFAQRQGLSPEKAFHLLGQYGRTNGIVGDLIAEQVAQDEGILCESHKVLVTAGCQEAIDLCISTWCAHPDDVLLLRSPTYIGATGVADLNRIEIASIAGEQVLNSLKETIESVKRRGKRPRALYLIPDFDNPTGSILSQKEREDIIAICAAAHILILEDNPYRMFRYEGSRIPTMHALDQKGCVAYLGTYSKTLCPSLRIGFAIIPNSLFGEAKAAQELLDQLSQAKSFVTVNTSHITQAMLGGMLLKEGGRLGHLIEPAIAYYRSNRDRMLDHLAQRFAGYEDLVSWNRPEGGFFMTVTLPFEFQQEEAEICARDYGVLTTPLSFFALRRGEASSQLRLAFSNVEPGQIAPGIKRLSLFVKDRIRS